MKKRIHFIVALSLIVVGFVSLFILNYKIRHFDLTNGNYILLKDAIKAANKENLFELMMAYLSLWVGYIFIVVYFRKKNEKS